MLCEIMEDPESTTGARAMSARAILTFAIQTGKIDDIVVRLERIEERLDAQDNKPIKAG